MVKNSLIKSNNISMMITVLSEQTFLHENNFDIDFNGKSAISNREKNYANADEKKVMQSLRSKRNIWRAESCFKKLQKFLMI